MRPSLAVLVALASSASGCIVSFNEAPLACDGGQCTDATAAPDVAHDHGLDVVHPRDATPGKEAGSCRGVADGGLCGAGDPCHEPPICIAGACTSVEKADGTPCGVPEDACHSIPACETGVCGASKALADGTQWKPGDDNARCCAGVEVETTSVANCGVCTVKCIAGQSCTAVDGHYFCTPCTSAAGQCWSGCCSNTLTPDGHCSPSECSTGDCRATICPDGSHCQSDTVNYCSY